MVVHDANARPGRHWISDSEYSAASVATKDYMGTALAGIRCNSGTPFESHSDFMQ